MVRIKVREIINLFDEKQDGLRGHISSIINLVGEDLGTVLFKRYYEETFGKKVIISPNSPLSGTKKGPRLDRWIYAEQPRNKYVAFQTEIKNWSAYAIGAHQIINNNYLHAGKLNYKDRFKYLSAKEKNGENKVFYSMNDPKDLPFKAKKEPLIIYWLALSRDGKNPDPFFSINLSRGDFKKLNVFSISNYLRSIKAKELNFDMPNAQKRINLLKKYFLVN